MTRYRSRTKVKLVERDFPHHVELVVPEGGFGGRLDEMHNWHRAGCIRAMHGRTRRDANGWYVTVCFADSETATAFSAEFGGEWMMPPRKQFKGRTCQPA